MMNFEFNKTADSNNKLFAEVRIRRLVFCFILFIMLQCIFSAQTAAEGIDFWNSGFETEREPCYICGFEEHEHDDGCYYHILVCGFDEEIPTETDETSPGHIHSPDCYEAVLACQLLNRRHDEICKPPDIYGYICGNMEHEHTYDACWGYILICGQEISFEHNHTTACCGYIQLCTIIEHTHSEDCLPESEPFDSHTETEPEIYEPDSPTEIESGDDYTVTTFAEPEENPYYYEPPVTVEAETIYNMFFEEPTPDTETEPEPETEAISTDFTADSETTGEPIEDTLAPDETTNESETTEEPTCEAMDHGLTFKGINNIKIYDSEGANESSISESDTEGYTLLSSSIMGVHNPIDLPVSIDGSIDNGFKIEFRNFIDYKAYGGGTLVITYMATLNEIAIVGPEGNENNAFLEYSSNPNDVDEPVTSPETEESRATVYTYDVNVFKYTIDSTEPTAKIPLQGAMFKLVNSNNEEIPVVRVTPNTHVYRIATKDEIDAGLGPDGEYIEYTSDSPDGYSEDNFIVSPSDGTITIRGLGVSEYALIEVKAPDGYNLADDPKITFTIKAEGNGFCSIQIGDDYGNTVGIIEVLNRAGVLFPSTGGIGSTIFTIVGATMVGAGLVALVIFRKKIFGSK